jgi:ATP-dependent helicase HrpA
VLRALPKQVRKLVVPGPEYAARAVAELDPTTDFNSALAAWITRATGQSMSAEEVAGLQLPDYLRFNIRVVDLQGATLSEARDLPVLHRSIRTRRTDAPVSGKPISSGRHRSWDFETVPTEQTVERGDLRFVVYPTLRDCGDGVELVEARSESEAGNLLRKAVLRLAILALPEQYKYARKRFSEQRDLMLLGQGMSSSKPLADGLAERAFELGFLLGDAPLPRSAEEFELLLNRGRADFGAVVDHVATHIAEVLREARLVREKSAALSGPVFKSIVEDTRAQMSALIPPEFPLEVSTLLWPHLPRFLKALARRLDKVAGNLKRDVELVNRVAPFAKALRDLSTSDSRPERRPELDRLHWMIEEFRVSLFAQDLRTALPVSEKRLAEQVDRARGESKK